MSYLKWDDPARRALLGIAALAIGCQAALAASTTLVCTNPYQNGVQFTIDLDQTLSTVTINNPQSASSAKSTAIFDAQSIKFKSGSWAYTIDRITGTTIADSGDGTVMNFPCHVGKAQF
jgi:hypothetical protein